MAGSRRFINFLYPGGTFDHYAIINRIIVEFATQVLGWTLYDSSGSGWTSVVASGSSADTTSYPDALDMTGSGRSWSSGDEDMLLTLTGVSGADAAEEQCNGIYRIKEVVDTNTIKVNIQRGVHSDGLIDGYTNLSWRLWDPDSSSYSPSAADWAVIRSSYSHAPSEPNFDIRIEVGPNDNTWKMLPRFEIGPYGTWDNVGHAWDDSRNTGQLIQGSSTSNTPAGVDSVFVFGDDDHLWMWWNHGVTTQYWHCLGIGQIIEPFNPNEDTNPGAIYYGHDTMTLPDQLVGRECGGTNFSNKGYMLAEDDATSVAFYLMVPSCPPVSHPEASVPVWHGYQRRISRWGNAYVRADILAESITASHMEIRGRLIDMWVGGAYPPFGRPFGNSYVHLFGGLSHPWHNSNVLYLVPFTFDWPAT